ncbi:hypothetical protein [Defluviitalea phaphyphila]|uniref:hypothetical protein n=1 Tax=Defluviitalea phaphyphila TaxID=1473580 RepID=UPI000730B629|nr:hypothetical protein [Defluviitalea phaphyphila]
MEKQGEHPVIYLTFKDEKHSEWENCKKSFSNLFSRLYLEDVPIQEGYTKGYYNKIIEFMRNLLSGGL